MTRLNQLNFSGTLFTALSECDIARAKAVKATVLKFPIFVRPAGASDQDWERRIRDNVKDDLNRVIRNLGFRLVRGGTRL